MTTSRDLAGLLSDAAGAAFVSLGLEASLGAVRRSDRPDLADFQCNGAMAAAKKLGKNPRDIATAVVDALKTSPLVASSDVAGPGFINVKLSAEGLSKRAPLCNVTISNVPGAPQTLYLQGARLDEAYPVSIPMDYNALMGQP